MSDEHKLVIVLDFVYNLTFTVSVQIPKANAFHEIVIMDVKHFDISFVGRGKHKESLPICAGNFWHRAVKNLVVVVD